MVYGYRLNDQKDWVKMKEFESVEQYKTYVENKRIPYSFCSSTEVDLRGRALQGDKNE
jgi:hypothetical protein